MANPPSSGSDRVIGPESSNNVTTADVLARCTEVEAALESLRIRYEQYFLGMTRLPPSEDHALVRTAVLQLRNRYIRNTSVRFRVQSLHNRFLTFERLWQRTCREIEEGTYRRDLLKLRRKSGAQANSAEDRKAAARIDALRKNSSEDDFAVDEEEPSASDEAQAVGGAPNPGGSVPAAQPAAPAPVPTAAAAAPVRSSAVGSAVAGRPASSGAPRPVRGSLDDARLRELYDTWIRAKRQCRESTEGLDFERMANSIRRQVPELMRQHNASSIDFKVVIKGGKAILKAVPR